MEDLSQLPPEILVEIARRLKKLEDFTSFRSVSKSLHASAKMEYFEGLRLRQRTPYLMLSVRDDGNEDIRELYSLVEGESIVASLKVPNFKNKKCLESLGWLLVSEVDGSNSLLDPFSGTEIPLPHQNTFPGYEMVAMDVLAFFSKMVLSSRPSETSDFVLMVIGGGLGHLAYWRLGEKAWNRIKERPGSYSDVVYNGDGQFYAFSHPAVVYGFNLSTSDNQIESRIVTYFIVSESERANLESVTYVNVLVATKRVYLLKTVDDSLLIITRTAPELSPDGASYITSQFQVYEVDTETGKWKEIHSLGRMAVFVGLNSTIAVDATRHPGRVFKANHIYFTDDDWEFYYFEGPKGGGMDCGVYDLETGIIEPLYPGEPLFNKVSPSIWITPCF